MKFITYLCIAVSGAIFCSCNGNAQNEKVLNDLKASNESMTNFLQRDIDVVYEYFEESIRDELTKLKAEHWFQKATALRKMSFHALSFIDSLKIDFINKNGQTADRSKVKNYFIKKNIGKILFTRLSSLEDSILKIDPLLLDLFKNEKVLFDNKITADLFVDKYFEETTIDGVWALLSYLKLKLKIAELNCARLMSDQWTNHNEDFKTYSAIVSINSKNFKVGDEIEITAGVGSLSVSKSNQITIYGTRTEINEKGEAIFKMKASEQIGKHVIPVTIETTDEFGNKLMFRKDVEFRITRN